ncbi:MAG: nucleotidyltransferase family protein [Candidatus Liptonbacteria bacterium]|nr:nucleotidyltransferase family protein [Candidatus Liptonbacteria bacterium]
MDAIILAGGEGKRLQSVVAHRPKPMAFVADRPFLEYLIRKLKGSGAKNIVLSVGYKADVLWSHFGDGAAFGVSLAYIEEKELLGTGGAIRYAAEEAQVGETFFVLNGDSYFDVDYGALLRMHEVKKGVGVLALRKVMNPHRSGVVELDAEGRITKFHEKKQVTGEALINGGVYVLSRRIFEYFPKKEKFSLEEEGFPAAIAGGLYGVVSEGYFIDIGIPEDFAKAQEDFKKRI